MALSDKVLHCQGRIIGSQVRLHYSRTNASHSLQQLCFEGCAGCGHQHRVRRTRDTCIEWKHTRTSIQIKAQITELHALFFLRNTDLRLFTQTVSCRGLVMPWATAWLDTPYQILVLSGGVWWSLLLDIRCLWLQNMTSYPHLQINVLAKFVDTTCIFRDAGAAVGQGVQ